MLRRRSQLCCPIVSPIMQPSSTSSGSLKLPVEALPECVVGLEMPDDCFRIGEGGFLAVVIAAGFFEVQQIEDLVLDQRATLVSL